MNKAYQILFFIFILCLYSLISIATTYTTTTSGDWSEIATWSGGVVPPTDVNNDIIIISSGHNVTLGTNLIFNNSCELTVYGYLTVNANFTVNNSFTLTVPGILIINGTFEANNTAAVTIDGDVTITGDCLVKNTASIDVDGAFSIYGDFDGNNNNVLTGSGEVNINGAVDGIDTGGYTGTVTSGYSSQKGFVNNGCVIKIGSNDVIYIDGDTDGDFSNMFYNGELGKVDSDGTIILEGDWNNLAYDSVFINNDASGNVVFKGTTEQTLGGSKLTDFESLTVNNSAGVVLDENIIINQTLTFTEGEITTGTTDTVIVENTAEAAISSQAVGKSVNGNLRRYMIVGSYDFPLSDGTNYQPAILDVSNLGSMNYVSAKFVSGAISAPAGLDVNGTEITAFLDNGYWSFSPDDGTGVEYDITLTSSGHTNGGDDPAQHAVFKRETTVWESVGDHSNATQSGTGTDPITAKRSNLVNFSDFIIGKSESNPLSVELIRFEALCGSNNIQLNWETASEYNNESFKLMHSEDGINFTMLTQIAGAGNSYEIEYYNYIHENPSFGINYYKLIQIDYDGIESESSIISNSCSFAIIRDLDAKFINNQIEITFIAEFEFDFKINLFDPVSRIVYSKYFYCNKGGNKVSIAFEPKVIGIYILNISNSFEEQSKKIFIK
jgi:hypothetical protein